MASLILKRKLRALCCYGEEKFWYEGIWLCAKDHLNNILKLKKILFTYHKAVSKKPDNPRVDANLAKISLPSISIYIEDWFKSSLILA